ncbi:GWxTD domain-containing protein [candidate division KSB1 bacterium]|nr:GWxTD domain-containing protein [candidate division KSB1 bacterium]RQW05673.1 MAG: GWxTD domain-containing protein [candidate division KSB1 bacterium]
MNKTGVFLLFLSLFPILLQAQNLRVSVDWALFDVDAENTFIEIYFSFLQSDLNFTKTDQHCTATTLGQFFVLKNEEIVKEFAWKTETVVQDTLELEQQKNIVDKVGFLIPVGEYDCKFRLTDLVNRDNADSTTWILKNLSPPAKPHLSEIQLASTIRRAQEEEKSSPFYKNSLIVEPNPSLIYSYNKPALFFYLEAYNLDAAVLPGGYTVKYYVNDSDGDLVQDIDPKSVKKNQVVNRSVEFGMLNVGELTTGSYVFVVELLDMNNNIFATQQKKFYALQKDAFQRQAMVVQTVPFESSIFATIDSADIETEFQMIFYILTKEEHPVYKGITGLAARRQFLYGFWQSKFPSENVNDNPHRNEYFNRKNIADERFNAFKMSGWVTDRGRVYMVYGEPDDIERYPMEPQLYPHEIWFYNDLQGGVRFVFVDLEGHKNYRLIHSDLDGEISDRNYRNTLQRGY